MSSPGVTRVISQQVITTLFPKPSLKPLLKKTCYRKCLKKKKKKKRNMGPAVERGTKGWMQSSLKMMQLHLLIERAFVCLLNFRSGSGKGVASLVREDHFPTQKCQEKGRRQQGEASGPLSHGVKAAATWPHQQGVNKAESGFDKYHQTLTRVYESR